MKIFRRNKKVTQQLSQSVVVADSNDFPNDKEHKALVNFASSVDGVLSSNLSGINVDYKKAVSDMLKHNKSLQEQNAHLNKYILELVKKNEELQGRLSDMKVTL